jgi:hypothetical protein
LWSDIREQFVGWLVSRMFFCFEWPIKDAAELTRQQVVQQGPQQPPPSILFTFSPARARAARE